MLIDMHGRELFRNRYTTIGKPYDESSDFMIGFIPGTQNPEVLRPQRTVVKYNSTYMELVDRWDMRRGQVAALMLVFFIFFIFFTKILIQSLKLVSDSHGFSIFLILMLAICGITIFYLILNILKEMFTYRYYPIRFNRKTGKVYVMQANKKVEVFDWDTLQCHIQYNDQVIGYDIRACEVDDNGIIQRTFSFPYYNSEIEETGLRGHYEFVNQFMLAKTDDELAFVTRAVKSIYPVHERRETLKETFTRSQAGFLWYVKDFEAPIRLRDKVLLYVLLPWWLFTFVGRLLVSLTTYTPRFSEQIESENVIYPDDPYDLNKNPPAPVDYPKASWKERVLELLIISVVGIISLSLATFALDVLIVLGSEDETKAFLFDGLWHILLLKWV